MGFFPADDDPRWRTIKPVLFLLGFRRVVGSLLSIHSMAKLGPLLLKQFHNFTPTLWQETRFLFQTILVKNYPSTGASAIVNNNSHFATIMYHHYNQQKNEGMFLSLNTFTNAITIMLFLLCTFYIVVLKYLENRYLYSSVYTLLYTYYSQVGIRLWATWKTFTFQMRYCAWIFPR